jgi:hypothetical protein
MSFETGKGGLVAREVKAKDNGEKRKEKAGL